MHLGQEDVGEHARPSVLRSGRGAGSRRADVTVRSRATECQRRADTPAQRPQRSTALAPGHRLGAARPRTAHARSHSKETARWLAPARLDPTERARRPGESLADQPTSTSWSSAAASTGAGVALDAATRGLQRRAGRAARLRLRHVLAQLQALPRRPALPRAAELPPGARGAAGARADADPARARTWSSRCRSSTRCKHRVWERPYVTAGLTLYDTMGGAQLGARATSS